MQLVKGYVIIDEQNKVVMGYVKNGRKIKYIAYDNTESFAVNVIPNKEILTYKLNTLTAMSGELGDGHIFSYVEIY